MTHPRSDENLVVAHYHTTLMPYKTGQDYFTQAKEDVKAAEEMGLDGFAINAFWGEQGVGVIDTFIRAAEAVGAKDFKVFLSADMGMGFKPEEIRSVITRWGNDPHYLKVDGKPLLSTYGGDNLGNAWWENNVLSPLQNQGYDVEFVPYFDRTNPNGGTPSYAEWKGVIDKYPSADGLFNFLIPGSVPFRANDPNFGKSWWSTLDAEENLASALHDNGKTFMAPFLPYYWAVDHSVRQYMEYQGGRGMENQWKSIIEKQKPDIVQVVTWNDWTESTFIQPTKIPKGIPGIPSEPHLGYYELMKYYINWFHTGKAPTITEDAMFYFYRLQPKDAVPSNDDALTNTPFDKGQLWGNVQDVIYVTTALESPGELRVTTGNQVKTFQVGAGIVHTDVPFSPGTQKFELVRNGAVITTMTGDPIDPTPEAHNYNVHSGYAVAGGPNSNSWEPQATAPVNGLSTWFSPSGTVTPPLEPTPTPIPEQPTPPAPPPVDTSGRDNLPDPKSLIGDIGYKNTSYTMPDWMEHMYLTGTGNINATGNYKNNVISGNSGANVINGGAGNDWLLGAAGNDTIIGGRGADALKGNTGADKFVVNSASETTPGSNRDTIQDFTIADGDRIILTNIDANTRLTGNQAFTFIDEASFSGRAGQLQAVDVNGGMMVRGDLNGDRIAEFEIMLAGVPHTTDLSAAHFAL